MGELSCCWVVALAWCSHCAVLLLSCSGGTADGVSGVFWRYLCAGDDDGCCRWGHTLLFTDAAYVYISSLSPSFLQPSRARARSAWA